MDIISQETNRNAFANESATQLDQSGSSNAGKSAEAMLIILKLFIRSTLLFHFLESDQQIISDSSDPSNGHVEVQEQQAGK